MCVCVCVCVCKFIYKIVCSFVECNFLYQINLNKRLTSNNEI